MSLILDALKRSEQERANNRNNPGVNIALSENSQHQTKQSRWAILFAALFLLALATILVLFLNKKTDVVETNTISKTPAVESMSESQPAMEVIQDKPPATPETPETDEPTLATPPPLSPPALHTQTRPRPASPAPLAQQAIKKPPVKKQPITEPPVAQAKDQPPALPQTPAIEPANGELSESTSDTVNEEQPADAAAPALNELPDNDQMIFLNYEINTHFYSSKPGRSFALINMKKYREGQFIDGSQMKIEKITAEGVVVDYGRGTVLLRSY